MQRETEDEVGEEDEAETEETEETGQICSWL